MSILYNSNLGCFISHENLINKCYIKVEAENGYNSYNIDNDLFQIKEPFKKYNERPRKRKLQKRLSSKNYDQLTSMIEHVKDVYKQLRQEIANLLPNIDDSNTSMENEKAVQTSNKVYNISGRTIFKNTLGGNNNEAKCVSLNNHKFLFPKNCRFFCKDIAEIEKYLSDEKYDLIVIDPPWWNKYVRRKNIATNDGYKMMYNENLKDIPIETLLTDEGLVVVWCTNSMQNLQMLKTMIFPKWNVNYKGRWYWLKITQTGEPVCNFSIPPGKQPFEQIIFASRTQESKIMTDRIIISIPSALHSHKPPLTELLQEYVPKNPKCLELFARYLLPNWTSWGLEAIRFQHECLYKMMDNA